MLKRLSTLMVMPKKKPPNSKTSTNSSNEPEIKQNECVYTDKKGNVNIRVLAKPGAKNNQITGLTEEGVGVQINAPPVDGEANSELLKFMSRVLNVRKSDIGLEKGAKSRQKTLQVSPGAISVDEAKNKLKGASDK